MRGNRPKFQLARKISGWVLAMGGIWMGLDAMGLHLHPITAGYHAQTNFAMVIGRGLLPAMLGIYLLTPKRLFSKSTQPDGRIDFTPYDMGLMDQEATPETTFKMGQVPRELDDFVAFLDRRDDSLPTPPAFK